MNLTRALGLFLSLAFTFPAFAVNVRNLPNGAAVNIAAGTKLFGLDQAVHGETESVWERALKDVGTLIGNENMPGLLTEFISTEAVIGVIESKQPFFHADPVHPDIVVGYNLVILIEGQRFLIRNSDSVTWSKNANVVRAEMAKKWPRTAVFPQLSLIEQKTAEN